MTSSESATTPLVDARNFAVLTLSFSAAHVGANMLGQEDRPCPYDGVAGLVASVGTFLLYALAAWAAATWGRAGGERWRRAVPYVPYVRDALGIVPGVWFQITVKPEGFYAGVPVDGCDMRHSGYAMALWVLGEMLTFGAALHLISAIGFGRNVGATVGVVIAAAVLQALTGVAAASLAEVYYG